MIPVILYGVIAAKFDDIERIDAPLNINVEVDDLNFSVTFDEVVGAVSYRWRKSGDEDWTDIGADTFFDSNSTAGEYTVQIQGIEAGGIHGKTSVSDVFELSEGGGGTITPVASIKITDGANIDSFLRATPAGYTTTGDADEYQREAAINILRVSNGGVLLEDDPTQCSLIAPGNIVATADGLDIDVTFDANLINSSISSYEYRKNDAGSWTDIGLTTSFTATTTTPGDYVINVRAKSTSGVAGAKGDSNSVTTTGEAVLTEYVTGVTFTTTRNDFSGRVGFKATVARPMVITDLARYCISGNSQSHQVQVVLQTGIRLAIVTVDSSLGTPDTYQYASILPVPLDTSDIIDVLSAETSGGDLWHNEDVATVTDIATLGGSSFTADINHEGMVSAAGKIFVPVNFKYTETVSEYPSLLQKGSDDTVVFNFATGGHLFLSTKFTAGASGTVTRAALPFLSTTASGSLTVSIYTDNSGEPGTLIGTASVSANRSDISYLAYHEFTGIEASIVNGTTYHLVLHFSDTSHADLLWIIGGGSVSGHQRSSEDGTTWTDNGDNNCMMFRLYGTP